MIKESDNNILKRLQRRINGEENIHRSLFLLTNENYDNVRLKLIIKIRILNKSIQFKWDLRETLIKKG